MNKVSIIIPVFNTKKEYLYECIESLKKQTYSDIEIIIIDDGSKKEIATQCDKIASENQNIKVFHQKNAGISSARNNGLRNSTGKYICFIDSDDWLEENAIQKLVEASKDAEVTIGKFYKDNIECFDGEKSEAVFEKNKKDLIDSMFMDRNTKFNNIESACAKLYLKSFLYEKNICFSEEIKTIGEDWIFNFEVYNKSKKIVVIPDFIYHYRTNDTSVMNSFDEKFEEKYTRFQRKIIELFGDCIEEKYREEMDYFVIWCLHRICYSYYFSKSNRIANKEKIIGIKKLVEEEPYVSTIKRISLSKLPYRRLVLTYLLRIKMFFLIPLLYNL